MLPGSHTVRVDGDHRIELVLPEIPEGSLVSVTVDYVLPSADPNFVRRPGSAAGRVRIMPSFDDPLEEFEDDKY